MEVQLCNDYAQMHLQYTDPGSIFFSFDVRVASIELAAQEFHFLVYGNSPSNDVTRGVIGKPTLIGFPDLVFFSLFAWVT